MIPDYLDKKCLGEPPTEKYLKSLTQGKGSQKMVKSKSTKFLYDDEH